MQKRNREWAEPLAKGQHLCFELAKVHLLDDIMPFTPLIDETHEYYSLGDRDRKFSHVKHSACKHSNIEK